MKLLKFCLILFFISKISLISVHKNFIDPKKDEFKTLKKTEVLTSLKVFRHGARVPSDKPIKDWYINAGYTYPQQLTKFGEIQNENLAKKYLKIDSENLQENSIFYASPKQRCIDSGNSFLNIYFKDKEEEKKINLFENEEYINLFKNEAYEKLSDNHLIKSSLREKANIYKLYGFAEKYGILKLLNLHCKKCKKHPVNPLNMLENLKRLNTIYYCNSSNKLKYRHFSKFIIPVLKKGAKIYYYMIFTQKNIAFNYSKGIFKMLGTQIIFSLESNENFTKNLNINFDNQNFNNKNFNNIFDRNLDNQKFKENLVRYKKSFLNDHKIDLNIFIFAHNKNIMGLLFSLFDYKYLFDSNLMMVKFVGNFAIELVEVRTYYGHDFYVKVIFMDNELFLPQCEHERCNYLQFLDIIEKISIVE